MKIFVTGAAGQLGHDVINELVRRSTAGCGSFACLGSDIAPEYSGMQDGTAVIAAPYVSLDITDEKAVEKAILSAAPDVLIHCAAWTAVDSAEEDDKQELAYRVNATGTANLVKAVKKLDASQPGGCKMVYISTDYVFDGQGTAPWTPDCRAYAPLNVYGKTKLQGELAVSENLDKFFIVRIAWVFGQNGNNFIKTMLRAAKTHDRLTVVNDQIGTPTYTFDLAKLLCDMIVTDKYGYYHATNAEVTSNDPEEQKKGCTKAGTKLGYISWYDLTKEIFRQAAALGRTEYGEDQITVSAVTTAEYGRSKAARPFNSRLDKRKLTENGFSPLPTWQDALARYLRELDF